jgi:hypothetical protein
LYAENLDINKHLTVVGTGSGNNPLADTIIDPDGGSYGIYIHKPVNLKNLRVTGAPNQGIRVERATTTPPRLAFAHVTWENIASCANGGSGVEIHDFTDVSDMVILNSFILETTCYARGYCCWLCQFCFYSSCSSKRCWLKEP